jgi:hypothetical protein
LHEGCPNETHLGIVLAGLETIRNNQRVGDLLMDPPVQEILGLMVSCEQTHDQLWQAIFGSITTNEFPLNHHTYKKYQSSNTPHYKYFFNCT